MTPDSNTSDTSIEIDLGKERITVNLDKIDFEIVNNLIGVIGNSKSSVISQMVKEWILQNSEKMMNTWEIDLAGIRRKVMAEAKGVRVEEELEEYEKSVIEQFPKIFNKVEELSAKEASEMLKVNQSTIKKIIIFHNNKLETLGLNLTYKDGMIINKKY